MSYGDRILLILFSFGVYSAFSLCLILDLGRIEQHWYFNNHHKVIKLCGNERL